MNEMVSDQEHDFSGVETSAGPQRRSLDKENKLRACIECGWFVSRTNPICPKCRKLCDGVVCARCNQRLRKSDAFRACRTYDEKFYHFECIEAQYRLPAGFECPDCH